jgi:hypothetical protein
VPATCFGQSMQIERVGGRYDRVSAWIARVGAWAECMYRRIAGVGALGERTSSRITLV